MIKIAELEAAVSNLSHKEFAAFPAWFAAFDADQWDRQIEADVAAGRLDKLAESALQELKSRRLRKPNR